MNEQQPLDTTQAVRDDALLDALVRGEAPPADDELAGLLAAWRADLDDDLPALPTSDDDPIAGATPSVIAIGAARRRHRVRTLLVAAAAVVAIAGGAGTAAANAGPDSPLWPITKTLFSKQASSRVAQQQAEDAIGRARKAIDEKRYADADRLLGEATEHTKKVDAPTVVSRLLQEISALRGLLPGLGGAGPTPAAGSSSAPAGAGGGGGGGGGASPTAGVTTTAPGGGILPQLPIPLPSISLPALPLPSLPSLPLPTLPPLLGG